jgi:N-methylhydantoinase A
MRTVLVPRYPGVLSALGMLAADVTRDTSQTLMADLATLAPQTIAALMHTQAKEVVAALVADGEQAAHCRVEYELELRYRGQSHELTVPLTSAKKPEEFGTDQSAFKSNGEERQEFGTGQSSSESIGQGREGGIARIEVDLASAAAHFHELHERRYGHAMLDRPIEAVLLRARGISPRPALDLAVDLPARQGPLSAQATVLACLADDPQPTAAALYHREDLRFGDQFNGPAVVVQLDATTIIPPNWQAYVDRDLNLVVTQHV